MQRSRTDALVLAISTSAPRATVAVTLREDVLARVESMDQAAHAERLFALVDRALAEAAVTKLHLAAIAVDVGPGSFTGARIGVASAKGMALGLDLPLVGVSSLEAIAAEAFDRDLAGEAREVTAMIDAKKGEVFFATYARGGATVAEPRHAPRHVVEAALVAPIDAPDAVWIARLAAKLLARGGHFDPALVEPLYVRAPDAKPMKKSD